jgi:trimeric autotransporter adhesin
MVLAARVGTFYGQRMKAGYLYKIAGNGHRIDSGDTRAGMDRGPLVVDGNGNVVFRDFLRVRVVAERTGSFYGVDMVAGHVYTIAGNGTAGTGGDGDLAVSADISPFLVAVDQAGNLVFDDEAVDKLRVVPGASGTFYGTVMTAGHLYSIGVGADFSTLGLASGSGGIAFTDESEIRVELVSG